MFWAAGGVVAVSGAHVFAEFGLTIPRLDVDDEGEQFVPRNGGEKNYVNTFRFGSGLITDVSRSSISSRSLPSWQHVSTAYLLSSWDLWPAMPWYSQSQSWPQMGTRSTIGR
jgi:hypothetical protein